MTAVGTGVVVQGIAWGILALCGLPLLRFTGARLRWFGAALARRRVRRHGARARRWSA